MEGTTIPPITSKDSLYARLGGYDAIAAVADDQFEVWRIVEGSAISRKA
jgi:hypothetical protein